MGLEEAKSLCDNGAGEITDLEVGKRCSDCRTTKTPLWRGGPAGPKSLCNACGIRYRKKRSDVLGSGKKRETTTAASAATSASSGSEGGGDVKVKVKIVFRRSGIVKKQRFQRRRRRVVIGEEEQAAFCLMALSCG